MHPVALVELLRLVDDMEADDQSKREFKKLVRSVGSVHGAGELEHAERVGFARHLLVLREPRPIIRERLIAKFEVSRRQAYRDIEEALQLCHVDGTKARETASSEEATDLGQA